MDIKHIRLIKIEILFILLTAIVLTPVFSNINLINSLENTPTFKLNTATGSDVLIDIVSPHQCNMSVRLWDPEGDAYYLSYETEMKQDEYREIPYGVAITGNYSIFFCAYLTENINILIHVERGGRCLHDKIQSEELEYIFYIDVLKFYNNTHISHSLLLKTDKYYRFYFGRVSTIAHNFSSVTRLTHTITDESQGIMFRIYKNDSIASPANVTHYKFGTAVEADYRLNLTIYCNVVCVNVAYAVIEKYRIADGTDPNDDNPPTDIPGNNTSGIDVIIPTAWTVGMIVFVGTAVAIPVLILVNRKKKNPIVL
jgi:hypothetical protein